MNLMLDYIETRCYHGGKQGENFNLSHPKDFNAGAVIWGQSVFSMVNLKYILRT